MADDFFDVPGNQLQQNIAQFHAPFSLTPFNKMKSASASPARATKVRCQEN